VSQSGIGFQRFEPVVLTPQFEAYATFQDQASSAVQRLTKLPFCSLASLGF